MSGSEENSSSPEKNIRTRPQSVQSQVSLANCAGVWRLIPTPSREKSTMAMVPMDSANPTMWKHSRVGKTYAEELRGLVISTGIGLYRLARSSVYQRLAENPVRRSHGAVTDR